MFRVAIKPGGQDFKIQSLEYPRLKTFQKECKVMKYNFLSSMAHVRNEEFNKFVRGRRTSILTKKVTS